MEINYIHDRLRNGNFPVDKLLEIEGITVTKHDTGDTWKEKYTIIIDMTHETEKGVDVAFHLGMMVQSCIHVAN